MMLSAVCVSRIYYRAVIEIKMLERQTLFILVNTVLYEYGPIFLKHGRSPI